MGGIYALRNIWEDAVYSGCSKHSARRVATHLRTLRLGKHYNPRLQLAWERDGANAFASIILEACAVPFHGSDGLWEREHRWIRRYRLRDRERVYNRLTWANS